MKSWLRTVGRFLYYPLVAALWVALICIGLEAFETARVYIAEHAYKDYFDDQNRKVYRMVPLDELAAPVNQFSLPAQVRLPEALSKAGQPPAPAEKHPPPSIDTAFAQGRHRSSANAAPGLMRARAAFAALSEENRNTIATLEGELVLTFDCEGNYVSSYGEPLLEQYLLPYLRSGAYRSQGVLPSDWFRIFAAARNAEKPERFQAALGEATFPPLWHYYEAIVAPNIEAEGRAGIVEVRVREITDSMPVAEIQKGPAPAADSPWEITFFSYKKDWHVPNSILSTNNFGFRDEDVEVPKPAGVFRIVCVGGSTTEEGNSNEATYPNIMERKLCAHFGEDAVEVVNCGLCGLTSYTERRRIYDFLELEPDLILYYNAVNDICHKHFPIWLEQTRDWQKALCRSRFLRRYFNRWFLPPDAELAEFMNATTLRNLRAMHYAARERNVPMAICSFAYPRISWLDVRAKNYYDVNLREVWSSQGLVNFKTYCGIVDLHNRFVKALCEQEGMLYVPVAEHFDAGTDHFFDICHMTPLGLELKTNIIGAYVQEYIERQRSNEALASAGPQD